jgi:hypothetical protein
MASLFLIMFFLSCHFQVKWGSLVVQKRFSGTVLELDPSGTSISVMKKVNDRETRMIFATDFNTKVMFHDEKKNLSDVKVGDKVTVVYVRSEGTFSAKSILIEN